MLPSLYWVAGKELVVRDYTMNLAGSPRVTGRMTTFYKVKYELAPSYLSGHLPEQSVNITMRMCTSQ